MNYNPECKSDYESSDDNIVASIASNTFQFDPKKTTPEFGNTKLGLLIDSGSVCNIMNESLVTKSINILFLARWLTTAPAKILKLLPMSQFL